MKRGEIWWIDFDPSVGGEIRKKRPAVIVSNNPSNRNLNRVQVVPMTSNITRVYSSEALVMLQGRKGKAMANQLTTVSKQRMIDKAGELSSEEMASVERAIRVQLGLK